MNNGGARSWYAKGVAEHYRRHGADYHNPHTAIIDRSLRKVVVDWNLDLSNVLDLAAGSGEVSSTLISLGARISAIDPFTFDAYEKQIGQPCERFTFEEIAQGSLSGRSYSMIVCSFALHLCPDSILPSCCIALSQVSPTLLILSPHKRPDIRSNWGWTLTKGMSLDRVQIRQFSNQTCGII
ncbi:MAG TPA: hypothetical protein PK402_07230 [Tepidisphaeraceae bacterium]|nr:hypothetical protein [Tepidisphaeraceae bacterium]